VMYRAALVFITWGLVGAFLNACRSQPDYCTEYELPSAQAIRENRRYEYAQRDMTTISRIGYLLPFHPVLAQCLSIQCKSAWVSSLDGSNDNFKRSGVSKFVLHLRWQGSEDATIRVAEDFAYELGGWVDDIWFGGYGRIAGSLSRFREDAFFFEVKYSFPVLIRALTERQQSELESYLSIESDRAWMHWTRRYVREMEGGMCIAASAVVVIPCTDRSMVETALEPYKDDRRVFLAEFSQGCTE
jgi:hypothetical protein